jgi:hypothetical protein
MVAYPLPGGGCWAAVTTFLEMLQSTPSSQCEYQNTYHHLCNFLYGLHPQIYNLPINVVFHINGIFRKGNGMSVTQAGMSALRLWQRTI